jgi:hypothetical protein
MRDENRQAQIRLQGNIDKLNADIDRCVEGLAFILKFQAAETAHVT